MQQGKWLAGGGQIKQEESDLLPLPVCNPHHRFVSQLNMGPGADDDLAQRILLLATEHHQVMNDKGVFLLVR